MVSLWCRSRGVLLFTHFDRKLESMSQQFPGLAGHDEVST